MTGFIFVAAIIVILFAAIRLSFEVFQFFQLLPTFDYIKDLINWIEVILFVCAILFAFCVLHSMPLSNGMAVAGGCGRCISGLD